jgi:hypothetical protein
VDGVDGVDLLFLDAVVGVFRGSEWKTGGSFRVDADFVGVSYNWLLVSLSI